MLRFMSKILGLFILIFSIQAYATTERQAQAVDNFIDSFIKTFQSNDIEGLEHYYHPDAVAIGSAQDEILQGRDKIMKGFEKDMSHHTGMHIEYKRIAVNVQKDVAFAAYNLKVIAQVPNQDQPAEYNFRFSLGLVKYHHAWHIIQSHLSAPSSV